MPRSLCLEKYSLWSESTQDTGSFEIVVRSSRCKHCVHPTTPYDHALSKTYKENGTMTQHVYGSGPCTTLLGFDTVEAGSLKLLLILDERLAPTSLPHTSPSGSASADECSRFHSM